MPKGSNKVKNKLTSYQGKNIYISPQDVLNYISKMQKQNS
jgi:hypothetical protein